jgi:hypothetical protein
LSKRNVKHQSLYLVLENKTYKFFNNLEIKFLARSLENKIQQSFLASSLEIFKTIKFYQSFSKILVI